MAKKGQLIKNIVGQKFYKLTVIRLLEKKYNYNTMWLCKCECGNEIEVVGYLLKKGNNKSCGCLKTKVDGWSRTRFYWIYRGMIQRCTTPTKAWKYYGGKGIKVLWKSFKEFKDDMHEDYLKHIKEFGFKQTSLDRIDGNGHYCKKNCRWATWKTQNNNKSK